MVSNIPIVETISVLQTSEETKDKVLFSMQIAVKQVQYYTSVHGLDVGLPEDVKEVQELCDSLDRILFHGLRQFQQGYWPFVKEFTHSGTVKFLEGLETVCTGLQYGRAWLCVALNENSLESYFRSFQQNPRLLKKHYATPALLRDEQRMQLLLMLMAGLEYVPINLSLNKVSWGNGLSFLGIQHNNDLDAVSNSSDSQTSQCNTVSPDSQKSFEEDDSGIISCESAVEVMGDEDASIDCDNFSDKNSVHKLCEIPIQHNHIGSDKCTVSTQELERITRYINMTPENVASQNEDLEVIRTKVVRRIKKASIRKNGITDDDNKIKDSEDNFYKEIPPGIENANNANENRLSKATTDSGLSLETHCSSDSESAEVNEEINRKRLSFEICNFRRDIDVTFSTPKRKGKDEDCEEEIQPHIHIKDEPLSPVNDIQHWVEERGVPEGQEDPMKNTCSSQTNIARPPLLAGNDGQEGEEEISIYDIQNCKFYDAEYQTSAPNEVQPTNSITVDLVTESIVEQSLSANIPHKLPKVKDPIAEEVAQALLTQPKDLDLRVDNNTLLYLVVEVYEQEEEKFHKMFYGYLNFPKGYQHLVLLLLTNKCLYVLKPGNSETKFIKDDSALYSNIDYISVNLNYQSFTIVCKNYKKQFTLHTGDEYLTRSIISNLEIAIRRFSPKLSLPAVYTDATVQSIILKKFLALEMKCEKNDIELFHFVLVQWEDHTGNSPPVTPTGPCHQGFLMYRHKFCKDDNSTAWHPGYFILKGGVLYCMEDSEKNEPLFFVQICVPHCKGCRRLHLPNRPHAFEVILSNMDSLQLAAADNYGVSVWLQSFLQTVSLAGHFIDTEGRALNPCCMVLANDQLILAVEDVRKGTLKLLGKASICDLLTVFTDSVAVTCVIMEFELAEASNCSGEWIIFFESEIEKEKFLEIVSLRWSDMFKVNLQVAAIRDLSLRKKCRQIAVELKEEKAKPQGLCDDS